jgi:hypothetical protein
VLMPNDSPGIHDCDDGVTLISCLRSSSSTCLTSGSTRPSARTHPTGHSCSALTSQILRPRTLRMVLAYPANAETDFAVRVDHEASLTGWFRYASIARFERTSLRRSPHRNMPMISSRRKFADQFGSPSSPVLSRTPQAIWKDCSISSISVMRRNGRSINMFPRGDYSRENSNTTFLQSH